MLSDTRHSQDGLEVVSNNTELSVACEVCGRCYDERVRGDCDMDEGRMMRHNNVKRGRVID